MADLRRARCRLCKRHRDEAGPISWGGYCGVCGPAMFESACDNLHEQRGPVYDKWLRGSVESLRRRLAEQLEPRP